jgi:hypothetical protein
MSGPTVAATVDHIAPASSARVTHIVRSVGPPSGPVVALCGYVGEFGESAVSDGPRGDHCSLCLLVVERNGWSFGWGGAA